MNFLKKNFIMNQEAIIWLELHPSLYCFNQKLSNLLGRERHLKLLFFEHKQDETSSIHIINNLFKNSTTKLYLMGNGISRTLAYIFSCIYTEFTSSMTLLSVETLNVNHWFNYYLHLRTRLNCSRLKIFSHLSAKLLKINTPESFSVFSNLLTKCLGAKYIPGSILKKTNSRVLKNSIMSTLVINRDNDFVINKNSKHRLEANLKIGDYYRSVPNSRNFLHFTVLNLTANVVDLFPDSVPDEIIANVSYQPNSITSKPKS